MAAREQGPSRTYQVQGVHEHLGDHEGQRELLGVSHLGDDSEAVAG